MIDLCEARETIIWHFIAIVLINFGIITLIHPTYARNMNRRLRKLCEIILCGASAVELERLVSVRRTLAATSHPMLHYFFIPEAFVVSLPVVHLGQASVYLFRSFFCSSMYVRSRAAAPAAAAAAAPVPAAADQINNPPVVVVHEDGEEKVVNNNRRRREPELLSLSAWMAIIISVAAFYFAFSYYHRQAALGEFETMISGLVFLIALNIYGPLV